MSLLCSLNELIDEYLNGVSTVDHVQATIGHCDSKDIVIPQLLDVIWLQDIKHASSPEKRKLLLHLVQKLRSTGHLTEQDVKEKMESDFVEAMELTRTNIPWSKKVIRMNTQLLYKQQKYNLMREESEGYAKIISEVGKRIQSNVELKEVNKIIDSIIGFFDLDPNRVVDILLDMPESELLLNVVRQRTQVSRHNVLNALIGNKFQLKKAATSQLCVLTAKLIKEGMCQLDYILAYMSFAGEEDGGRQDLIKAKEQELKELSTATTSLNTSNENARDGNSPATKIGVNVNMWNKSQLCDQLFRIDCHWEALKILQKHPLLVQINKNLCLSANEFLSRQISAGIIPKSLMVLMAGMIDTANCSRFIRLILSTGESVNINLLLVLLQSLPRCGNVALLNDIWQMLKKYSWQQRYTLYGEWYRQERPISTDFEKRKSMIVTKRLLKRVTKDNVRQFARLLCKQAHKNPFELFHIILEQVHQFDNLVQPLVDCMRYLSEFEYDILMFTNLMVFMSKSQQPNKLLKEDGINLIPWLQNQSQFTAQLMKRYCLLIDWQPLLIMIYNKAMSNCIIEFYILLSDLINAICLVNVNVRAKTALENSLRECGRNFPILIAKCRNSILFNVNNFYHLKFMSLLHDNLQDLLLRFCDAFPEICSVAFTDLINKFHLDAESAWKISSNSVQISDIPLKSCEFVGAKFYHTFWQLNLNSIMKPTLELQKRIQVEKDEWFAQCSDRSGIINSMLQYCMTPRMLYSPDDALYCGKFVMLMHALGTINFSSLSFADRMFHDIACLTFTCTQNEAENLGKFLGELMSIFSKWYSDANIYAKEAKGNNLPGFRKSWRSGSEQSSDADILQYKDFVVVLGKWQIRITRSFMSLLHSGDYMKMRNCILVLSQINQYYPMIKNNAQALESRVQAILKDEKREDLKLLLTRYESVLKLAKERLPNNEQFHHLEDLKDKASELRADLVRKQDISDRYNRSTSRDDNNRSYRDDRSSRDDNRQNVDRPGSRENNDRGRDTRDERFFKEERSLGLRDNYSRENRRKSIDYDGGVSEDDNKRRKVSHDSPPRQSLSGRSSYSSNVRYPEQQQTYNGNDGRRRNVQIPASLTNSLKQPYQSGSGGSYGNSSNRSSGSSNYNRK